jgi:hypothetical protein
LNEHAKWQEGEMWTMQTTVTSTCANDLVFSFCSKRGYLKVTIPAFAENHQVTVVDTIKFAPSYFYQRNRCKSAGEVTITEMKLGYGSCNSDFGPTLLPTMVPTALPSPLLSLMPSPVPSYAPTTHSHEPTISPQPSLLPTITAAPTPLTFPPTSLPLPQPTQEPTPLPSSTPTMLPSALPTIMPSLYPSSATPYPTNVPTGYCPNELNYLHPVLKSYEGISYGLAQTSNMNPFDGTITRPFGLLSGGAEPTSSFNFGVYLNNRLISKGIGGGGSTKPNKATQISVILKTSTIYLDKRTVEIAYQLRDSMGRSHVLSDNLQLKVNLKNNDDD